MLKKGRTRSSGGLSTETVRSLHKVIKRSLNHAVKWQLLNRNVADFADPPRIQKKEIITLSPDEVKIFLSEAKKEQLYPAFLLAITTGMRRGEILGLRWKDINFDQCTISIQKSLTMVGSKPILQEPKTAGSKRKISVPKSTIQYLQKHKRKQEQKRSMNPSKLSNSGFVISTAMGTPVSPRNLLRSFYRILENTDLPKIRFHDLRHTHATLMLQQGEHPKIISERLGHANTRITLDIYSHVLPNMQEEATKRFEDTFLKGIE